jgi:hypothetical protein
MRLRVSHNQGRIVGREATDDLLECLHGQADTIAERVGEHELDVVLLGSYSESAMQRHLEQRVRAWEATRAASGIHVEVGN